MKHLKTASVSTHFDSCAVCFGLSLPHADLVRVRPQSYVTTQILGEKGETRRCYGEFEAYRQQHT